MFGRNADIAGNTLELLQRRRDELLLRIAAAETELAMMRRRQARDPRLAFAVGFSVSLAIGLGVSVALRAPHWRAW